MAASKLRQRLIDDAYNSIAAAHKIVDRLHSRVTIDDAFDVQSLRNASSQARQAAQELDVLIGVRMRDTDLKG